MSSGVLVLFGIGISGGLISALLAQRLKAPQIIGYIAAGLILGISGLEAIDASDIKLLAPFNNFALGIIGFLVGSELKFSTLKKYAPQFSALLIAEGTLAFVLVMAGTGFIIHWVTGSLPVAISGGIVLGAIASATDPASTISVLWENRAAGILTTTVIAIIALDDALAMLLYGVGSGVSQIVSGGENVSVASELLKVGMELGGSTLMGIVGGLVISQVMKKSRESEQAVALSLGILLFLTGAAVQFHFDIIIVTMTVGIILANRVPVRSKDLISFFKTISKPIYAVFFLLIGAQISIGAMPLWLWAVVGAYVVLRSAGKYLGSMLGARVSGADEKVYKYAGLGLFAQGGVAIGLSIVASSHFEHIRVTEELSLSQLIVFTVATTTLFVQIIGPFAVKAATRLSGEANRDVTEDDILADKRVSDCVANNVPTIAPEATVEELLEVFTGTDAFFIPVVDASGAFLGTIALDEVKVLFMERDTWDWIIVNDILNHERESLPFDVALKEGLQRMKQLHTNQIAVQEGRQYRGILDIRAAQQFVRNEMLKMRSGA